MAGADAGDGAGDEVIIHVVDDARSARQDFSCAMPLLVREMKYFAAYFERPREDDADDVDISVHCDVEVFRYLMAFIKSAPEPPPELDTSMVVAVVISAHFLQMPRLVDYSIVFLCKHLNVVLKQPLDLDCLGDDLVRKMADQMDEEGLELLVDRKDKIRGRLFKARAEALLERLGGVVSRCVQCRELFSTEGAAPCAVARAAIDARGALHAPHERDPAFVATEYLDELRDKHALTWPEVYWRVWASTRAPMQCHHCQRSFVAAAIAQCWYHPGPEKDGVWACCGERAVTFSLVPSGAKGAGCRARHHVLAMGASAEQKSVYQRAVAHLAKTQGPSVPAAEAGAGAGGLWDVVQRSQGQSGPLGDYDAKTLALALPRVTLKIRGPAKRRGKKPGSQSPRRQRLWRSDAQRSEDAARMQAMIENLAAMRKGTGG